MTHRSSISVAICIYNGADVVSKAIESVLEQTILPLELLVVDDGSEDDSVSVVEPYAQAHPIVRCVRKGHSGLAKTRNHALRSARGQYIAFLDADDWYLPHYIERVNETLTDPLPDLIHTGIRYYHPNGRVWREVVEGMSGARKVYEHLLRFGNHISITSVTARISSMVALGGFHEGLRTNCGCEDWDMWIRLSYGGTVEFVPEILVEKTLSLHGPYRRGEEDYRHDQREVVHRGLSLDSGFADRYGKAALLNLYYMWAGNEMGNRHWGQALRFLWQATRQCPLFPLRLLMRIWHRQAVRRGMPSLARFKPL
jgi:glycosyltransferase involved in cell wall biosynthesis